MADQRSAGAVSEHSIKSSSHVESEHRIRASKKAGTNREDAPAFLAYWGSLLQTGSYGAQYPIGLP